MYIKNENPGNLNREIPTPGAHYARCLHVIELGTQKALIKGQEKLLKKIVIFFELVHTSHSFSEGQPQKPFVVSLEYTASMNPKANLFKDLQSWICREITIQEQEVGYPLHERIGAPCMITVVHKPNVSKPDIIYANIVGVGPVPQGQPELPPLRNQSVHFMIGMPNQFEIFKKIYGWIQKKIASSPEFQSECAKYGMNAQQLMEQAKQEWMQANNIQPRQQQAPPQQNWGQQQPPQQFQQPPAQQWGQPQQQPPAQNWQQQPPAQQQQFGGQPQVQYPQTPNTQFNPSATPNYGQQQYPNQQPQQQPGYQQPPQQFQPPAQQQFQQPAPNQTGQWNGGPITSDPLGSDPF